MKNALFAMCLVFGLSSCTPQLRITNVYTDDYRSYTKAGFFISPNAYVGEFDPISSIFIQIYPGKFLGTPEQNQQKRPNATFSIYSTDELLSSDDLLKEITDRAKAMGTDAVVNYKARIVFKSNVKLAEIVSYEVEGFAIKRK